MRTARRWRRDRRVDYAASYVTGPLRRLHGRVDVFGVELLRASMWMGKRLIIGDKFYRKAPAAKLAVERWLTSHKKRRRG